jgi:hypothetical protein
MGKKKYLAGETLSHDEPNWQPLRLAGADWVLSAFMAMHQIRLENGVTICAYKHSETRRYVHLDERGRAYEYLAGGTHHGKYKQVPPWEAFDRCIRDADFLTGFDDCSRLNVPLGERDDEGDWEPPWDPERGWPLSRFCRGRGGPLVPVDLWPEPARPRG